MKRLFVIGALTIAGISSGVSLSSNSSRAATSRFWSQSTMIKLSCSDSAGQQGRGNLPIVGGVTGLLLPNSADPAGLYPIGSWNGEHYFSYKAFLAVSRVDSPYATVAIIKPREGARLLYGGTRRVVSDRALIAASRTAARLPVCGARYTGYVGGIILTGPAWVTFSVSSPRHRTETVRVPIGTD